MKKYQDLYRKWQGQSIYGMLQMNHSDISLAAIMRK